MARKSRTKSPEERREDLMQAALELFVKQGVASTTIDDIVAGADVAKGTFYLYFANKEAVLAALRERLVANFLRRVEAEVGEYPADDWQAKLAAWAAAAAAAYIDNVALHDVVFHDVRPDQRRMRADNPAVENLTALLQGGARAGAWDLPSARRAAVFLFNGLHAAVDDAIVGGGSRTGLKRDLERLFVRVVVE